MWAAHTNRVFAGGKFVLFKITRMTVNFSISLDHFILQGYAKFNVRYVEGLQFLHETAKFYRKNAIVQNVNLLKLNSTFTPAELTFNCIL